MDKMSHQVLGHFFCGGQVHSEDEVGLFVSLSTMVRTTVLGTGSLTMKSRVMAAQGLDRVLEGSGVPRSFQHAVLVRPHVSQKSTYKSIVQIQGHGKEHAAK